MFVWCGLQDQEVLKKKQKKTTATHSFRVKAVAGCQRRSLSTLSTSQRLTFGTSMRAAGCKFAAFPQKGWISSRVIGPLTLPLCFGNYYKYHAGGYPQLWPVRTGDPSPASGSHVEICDHNKQITNSPPEQETMRGRKRAFGWCIVFIHLE